MTETLDDLLALIAQHVQAQGTAVGDQFLRLRHEMAQLGGIGSDCPFGHAGTSMHVTDGYRYMTCHGW